MPDETGPIDSQQVSRPILRVIHLAAQPVVGATRALHGEQEAEALLKRQFSILRIEVLGFERRAKPGQA